MHDHQRKRTCEVFMAAEGGTLTLSWWKSGLAARRQKAAERAASDNSPPPDDEVQQRRRESRMRTGLALHGFLMSDPRPRYDRR
jgi:hypothetical protein